MRKYLTYITLLFIIAGCSDSVVVKDALLEQPSYSMFGRISERNFYNNFNIGDSLSLLWESGSHGSFAHTSVSIYGDYVFVPDLSGRVKIYNSSSGEKIAESKKKGEIAVAPLIQNQRVYYVLNKYESTETIIYINDFFTGRNSKEIKLKGRCTNELLKDENGIYLLMDDGTLYHFDFYGTEKWKIKTDKLTLSSPAMSGDIIVFGNSAGEIVAVDKRKKEIAYREKVSGGFESGAAIRKSDVLIGDSEGNIFCFDLKTGNKKWENSTGSKIKSTLVYNDESIFIGNLSGNLFSLDAETGELNWKTSLGGVLNTTPLIFNDYIVQPDMNKKIHFVDVKNGEVEKEIDFDLKVKMSPVFFNSTLYFGTDYGKLFAYRPENMQ